MPIPKNLSITWLGHSTFKIVTPEGKVVLIDPWVQGNPACPDANKQFDRVDLMLITHGHFDHIEDGVALARAHQPQIVCIYEISHWLESKGIGNLNTMNKGGTHQVEDVAVTMTHADHSGGILDEGNIFYCGEPVGYVLQFSTGYRIYHAGDTALFGDMRLIGGLYRPKLAMLPIGDRFTMSPREAALAVKLLRVRDVIPMHFGTFPLLTGTADAFRKEVHKVSKARVLEMRPGQSMS